MAKLLYVHWNAREAIERATRLERAGHEVTIEAEDGARAAKLVRAEAPAAVVIDLDRLPSHGRGLAIFLRETKVTRGVPLVFVGGEGEKLERLQRDLPDAQFATWRAIRGALRRALERVVETPVVPARPDYSGTPLSKKLGIREGSRVVLANAPAGFDALLAPLPTGATVSTRVQGKAQVLVVFATSRRELEPRLAKALRLVEAGTGLWIAWPKKTSGVVTDVDQAFVRELGLGAGLVDNKVCAIDATWSGLRFAVRRA